MRYDAPTRYLLGIRFIQNNYNSQCSKSTTLEMCMQNSIKRNMKYKILNLSQEKRNIEKSPSSPDLHSSEFV